MSQGARHRVASPPGAGSARARTDASPGTAAAVAGDTPAPRLPPAKSGGSPVDPRVLGEMEARFGTSFSDVRVHDDSGAHRDAAEQDSRAYTLGNDIVFGAGHYAPHTAEGKQLLAHELAHVVQQRRGGRAPDESSRPGLEGDAAAAAAAVAAGAAHVEVGGASAPGVMHDRRDKRRGRGGDDDDGGRDRKAERDRAKERTQQRERERAEAGKDDVDLSRQRAEERMKAIEKSAAKPGAKSRSLKTKEKALRKFEEAMPGANGSNASKNKRKGNVDEALRTPSGAAGSAQSKHVGGGLATPDMELRPGRDSFTQPDYTTWIKHPDGTATRMQVNLKSNKIHTQTLAEARATARYNTDQAVRNARHLADGDRIIIDYAHSVPPETQLEMLHEHFRSGSPIAEVRFGTTRHNRASYEALAVKLASKKADGGSKRAKQKRSASKKSKPKSNEKSGTKRKAGSKKKATAKKKPEPKKKSRPKDKAKPKEKARPRRKAKPKDEAKPKEQSKPKESKARQTDPPVDTKAPEVKAEAKAPEARTTAPEATKAPAEAPKVAAETPKVTAETPKVEAPKVRESVPKGTGSKVFGAAAKGAGFLGDVSAVKGIKNDLAEGRYFDAAKDTTMLGLSHVPVLQAPMFAFAVGSTYWGEKHDEINEDAFDFGDDVRDVVEDIPLVGDIPYLPDVAGGIGAAGVAVGESVAYTVEGMGEAIADGAETLWDIGEEVFAPIDYQELIRRAREAEKNGD